MKEMVFGDLEPQFMKMRINLQFDAGVSVTMRLVLPRTEEGTVLADLFVQWKSGNLGPINKNR